MKERLSKLVVPAYVFLMFAIIIVVIVFAVKNSKLNNKETETAPTEEVTEIESTEEEPSETESESEEETEETIESGYVGTFAYEMFTVTNLNIRKGPGTEFEILTTVPVNTILCVMGSFDDGWSQISYDDGLYYVCSEYLSYDRVTIVESYDLKYYGIWTGAYWHFTPEEIDNQWNGMKKDKPVLPQGTTRLWQKYLYEKLAEKHCEWFYKYALAQAFQESGWNPSATSADGLDMGLFQFRRMYWDESYGNIYDYKANINAYVDRIWKYLVSVESDNDLYIAIDQHKDPTGNLDINYVNSVLNRLNELWEQ